MRLYATVYGAETPVKSVAEYGEHEVSIAGGPFERIRYAVVNLEWANVQVQVDLRDLHIHTDELCTEEFTRSQLGIAERHYL